MIEILLKLACVAACLLIVARCEPVLNRMGRHTPLLAFAAFFLLAIGASIQVACIALGEQPSFAATVLCGGIAALLVCERRLRVFFKVQKRRVQP